MTYKPIVSNVRKVLETCDIGNLSPQTYWFIIGHMGFIAHYNLDGFKAEYADLRLFCTKLQTSEYSDDRLFTSRVADHIEQRTAGSISRRTDNKDVGETIREIIALVWHHKAGIGLIFNSLQRDRELAQATQLAEKYGYRLVDAS